MLAFRDWLLIVEAREELVPQGVLQGYEAAFRQELLKAIARVRHPTLKAELRQMLDCPIMTQRGVCMSFTGYILAAFRRQGIHHKYDVEAALQYVAERMLTPRTEDGEPRDTVFAGYKERPDDAGVVGNPLRARFLTYLQFALSSIRTGRIPRLARTEARPARTISIAQGRHAEGDRPTGVSSDELAAPASHDADVAEMAEDIAGLLQRRERTTALPLVALFRSMLSGTTTRQQRAQFGDRPAQEGRREVARTVEEYARSSGNIALLGLVRRMSGGEEEERQATTRPGAVAVHRQVLSDQERDYRSIVSVVARFSRPVGSADLGRFRRRWLEYPPRQTGSNFRNRLEEVLASMTRDGVLKATQSRNGAVVYEPGPQFGRYRGEGGAEED